MCVSCYQSKHNLKKKNNLNLNEIKEFRLRITINYRKISFAKFYLNYFLLNKQKKGGKKKEKRLKKIKTYWGI